LGEFEALVWFSLLVFTFASSPRNDIVAELRTCLFLDCEVHSKLTTLQIDFIYQLMTY